MKKYSFTLLILFSSIFTLAQVDPIDKNGVAIGGYDVVAYFQSGKAVKGDQQTKFQYNGVTYFFSSKENQQRFEASPTKYIPEYDGYCALAVSYGKKISIDPQTFKITDDRLYLFYNGKTSRGKVNSLESWNKNEAKLLKKADSLWPDVKKKKYKPEDTL
ncbi:MAG: YHS domain-containing protein [Flammeovirgaceae bacterium]|nr:YHS domain-containing protein [Flammeovirgaceae bacterium]